MTEKPSLNSTVVFLKDKHRVLLGMKKKGLGKGMWNGFGGKQEKNESLTECAIRELQEESSISIQSSALLQMGWIDFFFTEKPKWNQRMYIYTAQKPNCKPTETDEMKPQWFNIADIDYTKMWIDDKYWLPLVLQNQTIKSRVTFGGTGHGSYIINMEFIHPNNFAPNIKKEDQTMSSN